MKRAYRKILFNLDADLPAIVVISGARFLECRATAQRASLNDKKEQNNAISAKYLRKSPATMCTDYSDFEQKIRTGHSSFIFKYFLCFVLIIQIT